MLTSPKYYEDHLLTRHPDLPLRNVQDLPGLIGGDSRGLSSLVRDTVSYIDPAFPNLEFHRRAAMDRAGYFMPGYKPQVGVISDDMNDVSNLCKFMF